MSKYQEAIVASGRSVNDNGENASLAAKTKVPEFLRMGVWNSLAPTRVDTLEKGGVTSAPGRSEGRVQWRKESLTEMGIRHVACSAALTAIVTGWLATRVAGDCSLR